MVEFLYNLFWFPMFSIEFIINVGLWVLFGYLAYEGYQKYIKDNNRGQWARAGTGDTTIQGAQFTSLLL